MPRQPSYPPAQSHCLSPAEHLPDIQKKLLDWFAVNQRALPWRNSYTPYEVWISEVMLQQTQMERGVSYFLRWMARFPDIATLANADEEEVLRLWEGLGYYSRARHVLAAARQIMERHDGVFPSDTADIRALPGIGPYTAGAIASIAFGSMLPCVDANVERVISRLFNVDSPIKQEPAASHVRAWALRLVPEGKAREHNQAMMELGALVCGKKPDCARCPLRDYCISQSLGVANERPVRGKAAAIHSIQTVAGVLRYGEKIFVQKRLPVGVWANLWEFPGGRIEANEDASSAIVREFMEETGFAVRVVQRYGCIRHGYTTYRLAQHCFGLELATLPDPKPGQEPGQKSEQEPTDNPANDPPSAPELTAASSARWVSREELNSLAMPTAHRKLAERLADADKIANNGNIT